MTIRNFGKRIGSVFTIADRFYLVLFFSLVIIFAGLKYEISSQMLYLSNLIKFSVADASLIMLLCLLPRGKWKISLLFIPLLVWFLIYVNILYYRHFEDLIPVAFYLSSSVLNSATFEAAGSSVYLNDFILLMAALLPTLYFILIKKEKFYQSNAKLPAYIVVLISIMISWTLVLRKNYKYLQNMYPDVTLMVVLDTYFSSTLNDWKDIYNQFGLSGYLVKCFMYADKTYITLSGKEISLIRERFAQNSRINSNIAPHVSQNKLENLIFIVVESWVSSIFELEDPEYVMPNISKLLQDSTVVNGSMEVLARYGNSSDAQFIYNTGLLPLDNEPFVMFYAYNDYPSIAKVFPGKSIEVIGEDGSMWNHHHSSSAYGFSCLLDNSIKLPFDEDGQIFKRSESAMKSLNKGFFIFITTYSMHGNYDNPKVTGTLNPQNLNAKNPRDIEYFQRLRYFDDQLGKFLDYLKESGIYDNSLIVIAGDHQLISHNVSKELQQKQVPFILLNSSEQNIKKKDITQADLFPTILYLMGITYDYNGIPYTGLGRNIFIESDRGLSKTDYEISEWMIKKTPSIKISSE